ncbi:MAG: sigma 54-interacting transcriptional regulator [Planctomycetes bacterium]|nr:sigma 54-interacting transcriptional regulator [Planctomycetota bacterium]
MLYLKAESGPDAGIICEIKNDTPLVIGRSEEADLRILDERASRMHCSLTLNKNKIGLKDLGSRNGTFFNNKRIKEIMLKTGDRFQAGNTVFQISKNSELIGETVISDHKPFKVEEEVDVTRIHEITQTMFHGKLANQLFRLQSSLQLANNLNDLLNFGFSFISRNFTFDLAALLICDETSSPRVLKLIPEHILNFEISTEIWKKCIKNGEALLLSADTERKIIKRDVNCAICVPLRVDDKRFGTLYFELKEGYYKKNEFNFALSCAEIFSPILNRLLELEELKKPKSKQRFNVEIIGSSEVFNQNLELIEKVAPTDVPVLIMGATGTGKELFAKAVYNLSLCSGDFVALNCAAIPKDMIEAELFGFEEGAFTGASRARKGKIELANNGVLFLDEISEMPYELQAILLRVLQDHEFYPLGAEKPSYSNFRLISATNRDLNKLVSDGKFREDLLFRIRVFTFELPLLSARKSDIVELAQYFCEKISRRLGKNLSCCSNDVLEAFKKYHWHGNVRELENVIERAVVLAEGDKIEIKDLPHEISDAKSKKKAGGDSFFSNNDEAITLEEAERRAIVRALRVTGGKKGETAKLLGCSWPTLNKKIKELKIDIKVENSDK